MELSKSLEHYIKTIDALNVHGEGARISDIAALLNVSKSSAFTAVKTLSGKGLARHDYYRLVRLTKEGVRQARILKTKYKIVNQFLIKIVRVREQTANRDACELEHILSLEAVEAFGSKGGFQSCFHD
jgi:Mn-dependent DtxR family transcriptional regulator